MPPCRFGNRVGAPVGAVRIDWTKKIGRRVPAQFIGEGESKRCSLYTVTTFNNRLMLRGNWAFVEDLFRRAAMLPMASQLYRTCTLHRVSRPYRSPGVHTEEDRPHP